MTFNVKKILLILLFLTTLNANIPTLNKIDSQFDALLLKDLKSNKILFSSNINKRIKPASLTKMMTAILALESGKLNSVVTITKEMTEVEPSKAGFEVGEQFYLIDLVNSALIQSANDSSLAIAIFLSGSVENFAKTMNEKAKKIGMRNSNFVNPNGLEHKNHYTTSKDLLKLTEYSIKNQLFNAIVKSKTHQFQSLSTSKKYTAKNHNKLLDKYEYAVGIKTGYTSKAGPCLVARAKKDNKDLVLIMLDSRADRWKVATKVFSEFLDKKPAKLANLQQKKKIKKSKAKKTLKT
ncbi:MAG: D-alanyl-D-alanine carboxypeptidase [Sulfurospirillaceae bacterium]|nr:D-alanyl-D-alanine carboxypeptidase [Sulfurospirillaceae bacterium]MDD3463361.1 D-alanyl-D-alanine carboxypeptidase [Sulfurospirillaceae bacterium]